MSYITDVVVHVDYAPRDILEALTVPLAFDEPRHQSLGRIPMDGAGGSKTFTGDVFAAAFNYLDRAAFVAWFKALPWSYARATLSMVTEGESPLIIFVHEGEARDITPAG